MIIRIAEVYILVAVKMATTIIVVIVIIIMPQNDKTHEKNVIVNNRVKISQLLLVKRV